MARSKSTSAAAMSANPFTPGTGAVKPMLGSPVSLPLTSNGFQQPQQQPQYTNSELLGNPITLPMHTSQLGMTSMMPGNGMVQMMQGGIIEDPDMYLERQETLGDFAPNSSTMPMFTEAYIPYKATQDLSPVLDNFPFEEESPLGSDITMSRTNSTNPSITGPMQMMRMDSDTSLSSVSGSYNSLYFAAGGRKRAAPHDELELLASQQSMLNMSRSVSMDSRPSIGRPKAPASGYMSAAMSRQASRQSPLSQQLMNAAPIASEQIMPVPEVLASNGEAMIRSDSASSNKSTQSQRDRAKDSLQRQIAAANSSQPLLPKPETEQSPPGIKPQVNGKTETGTKVAVAKSGYQRPKRAKVFCDKCTDNPEGFRGEHELRRHDDLKHAAEKNVWICVDPGEDSEYKPFNPISGCKNCLEKKDYGVYYNAAAHLRRAHFTEKVPRRRHGNGGDEAAEKRGGRGGGDWPPMSELKERWMKRITIRNSDCSPDGDSQEGSSLEDEAFGSGNNDELPVTSQNGGTESFTGCNFNNYTTYTMQPPHYEGTEYPFPISATTMLPQNLPIDMNMVQAGQMAGSNAAGFMSYNGYIQDSQFSQGHAQEPVMSAVLPSQQNEFGDFPFDMAMGVGC